MPLLYDKKHTMSSSILHVSSIGTSGCWLGEITISNIEAHQFGGFQTFWNESLLYSTAATTLSPSAKVTLNSKHFPAGAPSTLGFADANFGGAIFDCIYGRRNFDGTAVVTVCCKQHTMAYNTTEEELDAATTMSKRAQGLCIFMDDIGLPYNGPIFINEDNAAAQTIAHAGKITPNVCHIATKTNALQEQVWFGQVSFGSVSTNLADQFTKPLTSKVHLLHGSSMMGLAFIDTLASLWSYYLGWSKIFLLIYLSYFRWCWNMPLGGCYEPLICVSSCLLINYLLWFLLFHLWFFLVFDIGCLREAARGFTTASLLI